MTRLPLHLQVLIRMVFMSRLTPALLLLVAIAAFAVYLVRPGEPSQSDIVQAFNGFKTSRLEIGPVPGLGNITKGKCEKVVEADGFVCEVSYTVQRLSSNTPVNLTKFHRLVEVDGGQWAQQVWNADVQREVQHDAAAMRQWKDGHALWTLGGYTLASIMGAILLCKALPAVPWTASNMHTRATPRVGRPIQSGSAGADAIAGGISTAANSLTPAAAMMFISLGLAAAGFMAGGLWVPEATIDLRYMTWVERLCLMASGLSWAAVGFCLPMLLVRVIAFGVVAFALYAVVALPVSWVFTGQSPAQVLARNADGIDKLFKTAKPSTLATFKSAKDPAPPAKAGFEGYRQLFAW